LGCEVFDYKVKIFINSYPTIMIMNNLIYAILLSLAPISELRGGIPVALASGNNFLVAYMVCVLANILVIPLVFIFLDSLHKLFYKIGFYKKFFDNLVDRTRKKALKNWAKYEYWGLFLFVAIPLPITGAYTGTLAAWLLGTDKKKSFWFLALGVVVAGIIVTLVSLLGISALEVFVKK